jgi:hypothetical protein
LSKQLEIPMTRQLAPTLAMLCSPVVAHAQYATPPDEPPIADSSPTASAAYRYDPAGLLDDTVAIAPPPESTVRITTGPALRLSDTQPAGGVAVALDVGRRAAGARFAGGWAGVGRDRGLAQYTGELWLDFGYEHHWHPLLGAGGGVALIDVLDDRGNLSNTTVGVGMVRASLQYSLPIRDTDARAGIDVIGCVPAVRSPSSPSVDPWLLAVGTVTVGF